METSSIDNSIRNQLIQFNNILSQVNFHDLSSKDIQTFNELSQFCSSNEISSSSLEEIFQTDFLLKETCENLCRLFGQYGFQLEVRTARICSIDQSKSLDEHFKHRLSYKKVIEYEMDMLTQLGVHLTKNSRSNDDTNLLVTKIAFIGSGAIPNSSAIILNDHTPYADIYNIDISQEANQLASTISKQILPLHLLKRMHYITQDITEQPLPIKVKSILNQCQLIYLAGFVGINELQKLNILKNIVYQSNDKLDHKNRQYFVIRTAEGLEEVLFPKVSVQKIATLQADNNDIDRKFLFQIKAIHYFQGNQGFCSIIATNTF